MKGNQEQILSHFAEKLNSGRHCKERKRRGNLKMFDPIMNGIASLRSQ